MYWMFNRRVNVAHKLLRYSTSEKRMSTELMSPTTVNAFMQVLMIGIRPRTVHCVWSLVAVQCAALNLQGGVQKTKLLMLREYVNKTEKMGGTWTNTNSYRENEALSDIFFTWNILRHNCFMFKYSMTRNVRRILVRGVNAPLPPEAKKIWKIRLQNGAFWSISE